MGNHAPIAPSSMDRIISCPASVNLSKGYAESTSVYAQEGTDAHEELERCLRLDLNSDNPHVQSAIDYVNTRQNEGLTVQIESRVVPRQLGRDDCYGTADIILYDLALNELEIVDFKYGQGVMVEPADNYQLITYLLGALHKIVPEGYQIPPKLITTIIQPRIEHSDGPIRSALISPEALLKTTDYMIARLALIDAEKPVYGPSSKACKWCKAKGDCSERAGRNLAELGLSFDPIVPAALDDKGTISMERRIQILDAADEIRAWLSDVEDNAVARMMKYENVPHYKLVRGRANRRWKSDAETTANELKSLGFKMKEYMTSKLASPAAIAKVVKARKMKAPKRDAVSAMVEKPEGKLTLAHETDSRPAAILPKPDKLFEDTTASSVSELDSLLG